MQQILEEGLSMPCKDLGNGYLAPEKFRDSPRIYFESEHWKLKELYDINA